MSLDTFHLQKTFIKKPGLILIDLNQPLLFNDFYLIFAG